MFQALKEQHIQLRTEAGYHCMVAVNGFGDEQMIAKWDPKASDALIRAGLDHESRQVNIRMSDNTPYKLSLDGDMSETLQRLRGMLERHQISTIEVKAIIRAYADVHHARSVSYATLKSEARDNRKVMEYEMLADYENRLSHHYSELFSLCFAKRDLVAIINEYLLRITPKAEANAVTEQPTCASLTPQHTHNLKERSTTLPGGLPFAVPQG